MERASRNASRPAAAWLFSRNVDLAVFLGSAAFSFAALGLAPTPDPRWLLDAAAAGPAAFGGGGAGTGVRRVGAVIAWLVSVIATSSGAAAAYELVNDAPDPERS